MHITIVGILAVLGSSRAAGQQAQIRTSDGDIVLKVAEGKTVSFAAGNTDPVSINAMDSVLAKLESTVLGRNSRGGNNNGDGDDEDSLEGESLLDKLDTLTETTSSIVTAANVASNASLVLGQSTQTIVSRLADNLVGADNGVLSELLELNKNLAKIPELIELQTASNELAKMQGDKANVVAASATFASCIKDGKQVGCTLAGGKLAIAGHSFAANFPELYECVLKNDGMRKDLTSLKSSASSSTMLVCDLPAFDGSLPSKEV